MSRAIQNPEMAPLVETLPVHRWPSHPSPAPVPGTRIPSSARILEPSPVHESEEAEAYDAMIGRLAWLLNRPFVDLLSRLKKKRARVLDVGTGPGWIPIELARRNPHWEIWAVDASEDMLEFARAHARAAGVESRLHFRHAEAAALPFESASFDVVYSHFTLHHLAQPEELLNESGRVARAGGRVVIKDLLRQPRWKARMLLAFSRLILCYTPCQLQMYGDSLMAGLTFEEVHALLQRSRLAQASVHTFRGLDFVIDALV